MSEKDGEPLPLTPERFDALVAEVAALRQELGREGIRLSRRIADLEMDMRQIDMRTCVVPAIVRVMEEQRASRARPWLWRLFGLPSRIELTNEAADLAREALRADALEAR